MKTIQVRVKPNARESTLEALADGQWHAKLKSPPVDGKANAELIALVAAYFGVSKSSVAIKSGASGRTKLIRIEDGVELPAHGATKPAKAPRAKRPR